MGTLAVPTFQNKLHRSASQLRPQENAILCMCAFTWGCWSVGPQHLHAVFCTTSGRQGQARRQRVTRHLFRRPRGGIGRSHRESQEGRTDVHTQIVLLCVCVRVCVNEYVCRVFCKVTHTHIRTGKLAPMHAHTLTQVRVHPRTHTHMHTLCNVHRRSYTHSPVQYKKRTQKR